MPGVVRSPSKSPVNVDTSSYRFSQEHISVLLRCRYCAAAQIIIGHIKGRVPGERSTKLLGPNSNVFFSVFRVLFASGRSISIMMPCNKSYAWLYLAC